VEEAWNVPYTGHLVIIGDSKWEGKVFIGQVPKQEKKISVINVEVVCFQVIPVCPSLFLGTLETGKSLQISF
jgi:hypothetical protein